ncbi:MAG: DUF1002 domain-containing protein [Methanobacteriaceae archaeon]|nr:DUF1002 domain-containing protein [Methanobacteriaceae archaeon]MDP2837050.1 DUF1002 domain-containing protein [Methanobacteriaceae archaeon]MDP3484512.1 DUF1002 domain-containing protein [Methanobacteriaceae archaeon]MDP3624401.1 DUF1002 domain-containing protein [Methanobacteriaceae archaeon]
MKKYMAGFLLVLVLIAPIYAVSGFSITLGEATNNNAAYKNSMLSYFQSKTDKNVTDANTKVITASEVNDISKNITGLVYPSSKIFSCAMVDLSYQNGINVIVDKSKVTVVTPQMYANALQSSGIDRGYVVVSSPVPATGEAALAGVLKSYEIAVGTPIPEEAKKASTEELYLETQLVNQTGQNGDKVAQLFSDVKNQTQSQNLQNPDEIKVIVVNVANQMNINLSNNQTQQIADSVANSQKVRSNLTNFQDKLQGISQQVSNPGFVDQITSYLQEILNYVQGLVSGQ